jgi:hypothetical protein
MGRAAWAVREVGVAGPRRAEGAGGQGIAFVLGALAGTTVLVPATMALGRGGALGAWPWVFAWALVAVTAFWGASFFSRSRTHEEVEPLTAGDLVVRDPVVVTALCFFTLGAYQLWWNWVSTRALRRVTRRGDLSPGIDLLLTILTLGLWGVYVHFRNGAIVDALVARVRPSNVRWQVLGLYVVSLFCSVGVVGAIYRLAEGYREAARLEPPRFSRGVRR